MTWEVGAAWAGVAVSIIFGIVNSYRSRSTKRAAARAEQRSEEALAVNRSMEKSLSQIAQSFSRQDLQGPSGPQGPQGAPGGQGPQGHQGAPGAQVTGARQPGWNIEYRGGQRYALRNVGAGLASHVTIDAGLVVARDLPDGAGISLAPGQAHSFMIIGTLQASVPTDVLVTCDELEPQHVPVPSRSG